MITGSQIRAARALLRWSGRDLANSSGVSWPTIQRMEAALGVPPGLTKNILAVKDTLESAGIEFIDANGGGPGVRFREAPG
jgi:predicted transcriptional regulator